MYTCLWCASEQQDLRFWYKIIGTESNWFYNYCGMCDRCYAHEWKEYRSDYNADPPLQEEIEKRAWACWEDELSRKLDKAAAQVGLFEVVRLEFDGSGGKEKMIRRLRKNFWSMHAAVSN